MTPAVRRAYEWLTIAMLLGAATVASSVYQEPSWMSTDELFLAIHEGAVLVDIRSERLFAGRTIPGAVNIPERDLDMRADELPRDVPVVVFGGFGNDSAASYRLLRSRGLRVYDLGPYTRMPHGFEHHAHHTAGAGGQHQHAHP